MDLEVLMAVARESAQAAAQVHQRARHLQLDVAAKGSPTDLVTEVDREAERQLVAVIQRRRPGDTITGEEGASVEGTSGVEWILDPLDGTTNFVYGYPAHAIAVGVEIHGKRALGVVHDTARNNVYHGIVGLGAYCDDQPLAVRASAGLSRALIGTGFLPQAEVRGEQGAVLQRLLPFVRDVRRSGCPSLDLCGVASGALDAFYEYGLGRWDICAGAAIAEAAGSTVITVEPSSLPGPLVIAGSREVVEQLLEQLRPQN